MTSSVVGANSVDSDRDMCDEAKVIIIEEDSIIIIIKSYINFLPLFKLKAPDF